MAGLKHLLLAACYLLLPTTAAAYYEGDQLSMPETAVYLSTSARGQ